MPQGDSRNNTTKNRTSGNSEYRRNNSAGRNSSGRESARNYNTENRRPANGNRRRSGKKARQKRKRMLVLLVMAVILVLIIFMIARFIQMGQLKKYVPDDVIATGVSVDGTDLSGMTKAEAKKAIEDHFAQVGENQFIFQTRGQDTYIPLKDLGLEPSGTTAAKLVDQAYKIGREGTMGKRLKDLKKLRKSGYNIPVEYKVDDSVAADTIVERCSNYEGAAVNARIEFTDAENWHIVDGKEGVVLDIDKTVSNLNNAFKGWDKTGRVIEVSADISEPEITKAMLEALPDELASYSTTYGNGNEGRCTNVENGINHITDIYLKPGEEFSCNDAMAPYTEDNGYAEAASYEDGEIVQSMGGGICQVSSTLYNAVIFAELDVTERSPHSMLVHYVQPGRDAAIAGDVKDLKFVNNTENPIYISAWTDGMDCHVYIFGVEWRDPNRRIGFRSEVVSEREFETKYENDPELPEGYEEVKSSGENGAVIRLYKEYYEGDVKTDEEEFSISEYNPFNEIRIRGTKPE